MYTAWPSIPSGMRIAVTTAELSRSGEKSSSPIAFTPARVILQDFTGVPAIVDLAAMRDAMSALGVDPKKINPLQPVELVIDHSVQVDAFATPEAFRINEELDYQRNEERYKFLKWGQKAFDNFKVTPPNAGIVHQINLEHLALEYGAQRRRRPSRRSAAGARGAIRFDRRSAHRWRSAWH